MQNNYTCRHCGAVRGHPFDKIVFQFRSRFCDELAGDFSAVARSLVARAIEGHLPAIKLYFEYLMGKPGFKDFAPPPEQEQAGPHYTGPTNIILVDENGKDWKVPGSAGFQPANEGGQDGRAPRDTQNAVKTPFGDGS